MPASKYGLGGFDPLAGIDADVVARARATRLLLLDVDGVLTDGRLWFDDRGAEAKAFHAHDGLGIKLLQTHAMPVGIITSRRSPLVARRMEELGIAHLLQGCQDKRSACAALLDELDLSLETVAYVGDDIIDLPVMLQAGFAIAVADAHPLVVEHAHWVTGRNGGRGAVREACDLLLAAHGRLSDALAANLA